MRGNFCYVYILQSVADAERFYIGLASNLRERITAHNRGNVRYTSHWRPWVLKTYIAFRDRRRAADFECYLKSASGRAFVKKRL